MRLPIFICAVLFACTEAWAIGDSGGSSGCKHQIYALAASGTPSALEQAVDLELDRQERNASLLRPLPARSVRARQLLEIGPCSGMTARPLDYAVRGANAAVVARFLQLGIDPSAYNGSTSLYLRCNDHLESSPNPLPAVSPEAEAEAYALTLRAGGKPNLLDRRGRSALSVCNSIPLLKELVRAGIKPDAAHLEHAIEAVLQEAQFGSGDSVSRALLRFEFFYGLQLRPTAGVVRVLQTPNCGMPAGKGGAACQNLRRTLAIEGWTF